MLLLLLSASVATSSGEAGITVLLLLLLLLARHLRPSASSAAAASALRGSAARHHALLAVWIVALLLLLLHIQVVLLVVVQRRTQPAGGHVTRSAHAPAPVAGECVSAAILVVRRHTSSPSTGTATAVHTLRAAARAGLGEAGTVSLLLLSVDGWVRAGPAKNVIKVKLLSIPARGQR